MSLVNVFETLYTRMEIQVNWADEEDKDELTITLMDQDCENRESVTIGLRRQDLGQVIEVLKTYRKEMVTRAQLAAMSRFGSSQHQRMMEEVE